MPTDYLRDVAIPEYIPKLESGGEWSTIDKCQAMLDAVRDTKAKLCVEIGVWGGAGLVTLAFAAREQEQLGNEGSVAVGIDPWAADASLEGKHSDANAEWWANVDYQRVYDSFVAAVSAHNLDKWCKWHRQKSNEAAAHFTPNSIHVLHLDGNHSEEVSLSDVKLYAPLMVEGGYWFFDDANWTDAEGNRTTLKAQEELERLGFTLVRDEVKWRVYRKSYEPEKPKLAEVLPPTPVASPPVNSLLEEYQAYLLKQKLEAEKTAQQEAVHDPLLDCIVKETPCPYDATKLWPSGFPMRFSKIGPFLIPEELCPDGQWRARPVVLQQEIIPQPTTEKEPLHPTPEPPPAEDNGGESGDDSPDPLK